MSDLFWVLLAVVIAIIAFITMFSGSNNDKITTPPPDPE